MVVVVTREDNGAVTSLLLSDLSNEYYTEALLIFYPYYILEDDGS